MSDFVDHDSFTGITTHHDYDHSSGKTFITHTQDVEAILNRNKALQNDDRYKRQGIKEDYYHVGTIPPTVALDWKKKHGIDIINDHSKETLDKAIKLLQSNEYKYLRTVDKI